MAFGAARSRPRDVQGILGIRAYVASLAHVSAGELARLARVLEDAAVSRRAVVLSTCSRLEVYAARPLPDLDQLPQFERRRGLGVVEHLATVAAGADSIVVGETDVLGQVRGAFASATGTLRQLGDIAVAAAREARAGAGTAFRDAGHQLDLALALAGGSLPASICIVGTGAMARHLVKRARALCVQRLSVTGRHDTRAADLAADLGIDSIPSAMLPGSTDLACMILAFKGMPTADLRRSVEAAARRASIVIDLTMPPFDWPEAPTHLIDLESLVRNGDLGSGDRALREGLRTAAVSAARRRCRHLLGEGASVAIDLYRRIEQIRVSEVLRAMPHCDDDRDLAERLTKALVKKLFHAYGDALRRDDDPGLVETTRRIFLRPGGPARIDRSCPPRPCRAVKSAKNAPIMEHPAADGVRAGTPGRAQGAVRRAG